jgi:hypothetical protein
MSGPGHAGGNQGATLVRGPDEAALTAGRAGTRRSSSRGLFVAISAVAAIAVFGAYLFGLYSYSRNLWPVEPLRRMKHPERVPVQALGSFDDIGRLVAYPNKIRANCPKQTGDTAVILAIGQSNVANYAAKKVTTRYPDAVLNYFNGACHVAASPLLGAAGEEGEFLTLLADRLISDGTYKAVVIVSSGIGNSLVSRWQRDGDLNEMILATLADLSTRYQVTDVVWHQGESDFFHSTSAKNYVRAFNSLLETLAENGVQAPAFTALATKCATHWRADNPTLAGQRALVGIKGIHLGADTDTLLGDGDRREDNCHLGESGQVKIAASYAEAIRKARAAR